MNTILKRTKDFIFAQQTSIISGTLILAGMMLMSRMGGVVRDRILTSSFSKEELDIFLAAFRIPDLVFEILISGALSTTFIPFFIEHQKKSKENNQVVSSIMNIVFLILLAFIVVITLCLPILVPLIAPGFSESQLQSVIHYSRLLLISQLPFLVLGNFLTGISQANKSFLIPAIAPIIYNASTIVITYYFAPTLHLLAPVIGVIFGAFLFFLIQLPVLLNVNFRYNFVIANPREAFRFFRSAAPRILTIIVAQIEATIDLSLATLISSGSYTIFYLAQRLQLFPISIIGMSFGQASLPYLTDLYQDNKKAEFKKIIIDSVLNILFFTIPAAAFFMITRTPIIRLFYGGSKFDWDGTVLTAVTLSCFALSLPLHSIYYFLTRCFYAAFDTKTPFFLSLSAILMNAALSIWFTLGLHFPVWALALSFSFTMNLQVTALFFLLSRKIRGLDMAFFWYEGLKMLIASFNTALITYFLIRLLDGLIFDTNRTINLFLLILVAFFFFSTVYIFLCWLFGVRELYIITSMLLKAKEYQKKILVLYKGVE